MLECRQIHISGKVQGVFFRAATKEQADGLEISGWVKNLPDGSVLIHAEGSPDHINAFIAWCHEGPPRARVETVRVEIIPLNGYSGFMIDRNV